MSLMRPPASWTSSAPAAMSQALRPGSQNAPMRPAATYARFRAAVPMMRTSIAVRISRSISGMLCPVSRIAYGNPVATTESATVAWSDTLKVFSCPLRRKNAP